MGLAYIPVLIVVYHIAILLKHALLGTFITSIALHVEQSEYYKCHIYICSQSYLISCSAHNGATHGLAHISYRSRCNYMGCSHKLSGIRPTQGLPSHW
ncbi:Catabolic 3-dehydroquinase [Gossypium arboreum]|uniref:Catabolic 3-dehydroquinase n=1 Tax=Gossypium arboreum TaxID=29729 RepID=A0A0B0MTA4_GOSAR|nr:Catabolic 3-dehydroquinase [Gossypium arboreum]